MEDARAWVRWWRIEGVREMLSIVREKWDPLGLHGITDGSPDDEYDSYANVLASKPKPADPGAAPAIGSR